MLSKELTHRIINWEQIKMLSKEHSCRNLLIRNKLRFWIRNTHVQTFHNDVYCPRPYENFLYRKTLVKNISIWKITNYFFFFSKWLKIKDYIHIYEYEKDKNKIFSHKCLIFHIHNEKISSTTPPRLTTCMYVLNQHPN